MPSSMNTTITGASNHRARHHASKPCPLFPLSLSSLMHDADAERFKDVGVALNRMAAIAQSKLTSYFYGMPEAFDAFADAVGVDRDSLFECSFGEAALRVSSICLADGEGGTARPSVEELASHLPRAFSDEAIWAMRRFLHPLKSVALAAAKKTEPSPPVAVKKPKEARGGGSGDVFSRYLFAQAHPPLRATDLHSKRDFLSDSFEARRFNCPEARLSRTLLVPMSSYQVAIKCLTNLGDEADALFLLGGWYESFWETLDTLDERLSSSDISPEGRAMVYRAMYLLFVLPFALLHAGDTPLNEVALREVDLIEGVDFFSDLSLPIS